LGEKVDLTLRAVAGANERTIVKESAEKPITVPGLLTQGSGYLYGFDVEQCLEGLVASLASEGSKLPYDFTEKKAEPHAFALALNTNAVHAIVPVAAANQRQPMDAVTQAVMNGELAMLVKGCCFMGDCGQIIVSLLVGHERAPIEVGDHFVKDQIVLGDSYVLGDGKW
jgi:hypothetical protein